MKNARTKTKPKPKTKTAPAKKKHSQSTYEKLETALASTASFAADIARETEGRIRGLASSVYSSAETDPAPRATDLLVHHHRKVEKLFDRLEASKGYTDATLRELADDLSAHIAIEERLFYPAVRKVDPDLILEGLEEHAMGRFALRRLLGTKASDHSLQARLKALKELMTNHHKEEEKDLFPKAGKAMSNDALHTLGAAMKKRFDADVKRGHEAVLASFDDVIRRPVRAKTPTRAKK